MTSRLQQQTLRRAREAWPADAQLYAPALQRAANTAAALRLVADAQETTMAALRRLMTRRELEEETARAIVRYAQMLTPGIIAGDIEEPAGNDILSRALRQFVARRRAAIAAREDEEADRALARMMSS